MGVNLGNNSGDTNKCVRVAQLLNYCYGDLLRIVHPILKEARRNNSSSSEKGRNGNCDNEEVKTSWDNLNRDKSGIKS